MDLSGADYSLEPSVDEGAFWHTNMDLYYGYLPGEVVEVEHEPSKYWLASIQYCFKHLVLLKWIGNYGSEFWIDTSMTNATTSSNGILNEFSNPKRLFPLGHHLQSQLKSQFTLEKPSRILVKPSLYNPSKDPYADILTVEDLLVHEVDDQNNDDTFAVKSTSDTASLALAKCKTKINYGQEDQDELEAALQSLNGLEQFDEPTGQSEPPNQEANISNESPVPANKETDITNKRDDDNVAIKSNGLTETGMPEQPSTSASDELTTAINDDTSLKHEQGDRNLSVEKKVLKATSCDGDVVKKDQEDSLEYDNIRLELCKRLQASAINKGRYLGVQPAGNEQDDKVFFSKPKQFFDVGGANHERLFVPGALLEITHTIENDLGQLDVFQWFAFVTKNVGGRLTLRWFLCDEPKFKQGRLEMKSCRSRFVIEESEQSNDSDNSPDGDGAKMILEDNLESVTSTSKQNGISAKSITFSMHFCNPKIHTISQAKALDRIYKLPIEISSHIIEVHSQEMVADLEKSQAEHIFDARRINLDKDRPLIDHILTAVRCQAPNYLDLIYSPNDQTSRREVLISCPKMTKLLKATVKRELGPGIFEVHSQPLSESNEVVKFVYPYDSSYSILPLDWATNHEECLSINPSRNPSPSILAENNHQIVACDQSEGQQVKVEKTSNLDVEPVEMKVHAQEATATTQDDQVKQFIDAKGGPIVQERCLKANRCRFPRAGGSFTKLSDLVESEATELSEVPNFDEYDPTCWSQVLRNKELRAPAFHCCIDYSQKEAVESRFKVMDQLEVVHPTSDSIICLGRIRKVVFPMLWIQLSSDFYTLVPFNLTDIYPARWCETYNHKLISLLPPRKRCAAPTNSSSQLGDSTKKRKRVKISNEHDDNSGSDIGGEKSQRLVSFNTNDYYEKEHFDLGTLKEQQAGIDYLLNEKSAYVRIFFNHKCFTGPSLSKSKICSLPQYVGPGPMRLVVEEVVTKVISVAYVPPRILNDLSSKSFEELLIERNLTNTIPIEFKAKYQKRVHRDTIPVCSNPDDVALYCECICEHIKCCYNLFGLNLYDGDDCPSHCRSLTKSNKFMKRATYYREKARQGEFLNQGGNNENNNGSKKVTTTTNHSANGAVTETSKPDVKTRVMYTGRGSSDSTNSSNLSRSDDDGNCNNNATSLQDRLWKGQKQSEQSSKGAQRNHLKENRSESLDLTRSKHKCNSQLVDSDKEFMNPDAWTTEDVARYLDGCQLSIFKTYLKSEGVDGQALLLLDRAAIEEHFQQHMKSGITQEEVNKLCRFVELVKTRAEST